MMAEQMNLFDIEPLKYYLIVLIPSVVCPHWEWAGTFDSKEKAIDTGKKMNVLDFIVELEGSFMYREGEMISPNLYF